MESFPHHVPLKEFSIKVSRSWVRKPDKWKEE